MRRFHNPRYAPESLERKLHPSGIALPVTAEYAPASAPQLASASAPGSSESGSRAPVLAVSCVTAIHENGPPPTPPAPPEPEPTDPWGEPTCPTEPNDPSVKLG